MNKKKEALAGWLFMSPAMIIFIALIIIPTIASFLLSFTEWNFLSGYAGIKFKGLDNFVKLFTKDRKFMKAFVNTVIYAFTTVPITIFMSLLAAYMLNTKVYLKKIFRTFFFIPYISSMVALAAVFKFLFSEQGPINAILKDAFGMETLPAWITDSNLCRVPVISVMVYTGLGFCLIVYMAALQNVPKELYHAAAIDGAGSVRIFFKITLPLISPTTFYLLIVRLIGAFKIFTAVNIMGFGGNSASIVKIIYDSAFGSYSFGYASAASWILVAIILTITLIQMWGQKKWVHY